ncbi:hypothetical protein [Paraburkholderia agricolaris]|uniref:hypothetical protein n=1 Tax=Paraburkholderia agricolaris TaxID=2152888 RepID=UPI0012917065|nr:hypothetical protein [Paraburkholderia agricolaris]
MGHLNQKSDRMFNRPVNGKDKSSPHVQSRPGNPSNQGEPRVSASGSGSPPPLLPTGINTGATQGIASRKKTMELRDKLHQWTNDRRAPSGEARKEAAEEIVEYAKSYVFANSTEDAPELDLTRFGVESPLPADVLAMLGSTRIKWGPQPPKSPPPVPETDPTSNGTSPTDLAAQTKSEDISGLPVKYPITQTPVNGDVSSPTKREEFLRALETWVGDPTAPTNELRTAAGLKIRLFADAYVFTGSKVRPSQLDLTPYLIKSLPHEVVSTLNPTSIELGSMGSPNFNQPVEIGTLMERLEVHLDAWVQRARPGLLGHRDACVQRIRDYVESGAEFLDFSGLTEGLSLSAEATNLIVELHVRMDSELNRKVDKWVNDKHGSDREFRRAAGMQIKLAAARREDVIDLTPFSIWSVPPEIANRLSPSFRLGLMKPVTPSLAESEKLVSQLDLRLTAWADSATSADEQFRRETQGDQFRRSLMSPRTDRTKLGTAPAASALDPFELENIQHACGEVALSAALAKWANEAHDHDDELRFAAIEPIMEAYGKEGFAVDLTPYGVTAIPDNVRGWLRSSTVVIGSIQTGNQIGQLASPNKMLSRFRTHLDAWATDPRASTDENRRELANRVDAFLNSAEATELKLNRLGVIGLPPQFGVIYEIRREFGEAKLLKLDLSDNHMPGLPACLLQLKDLVVIH